MLPGVMGCPSACSARMRSWRRGESAAPGAVMLVVALAVALQAHPRDPREGTGCFGTPRATR